MTVEQMASTKARLKQIDLAAQKHEERKKNPEPRGWGMTRRTGEHFANQYVKGKAPGANVPLKLLEFPSRPTPPTDDFHSALEPSDSSTDEGSTTDEDRGSTTCSDQPSYHSGHDTDRSHRTDTSNRAKRHNKKKCKEDQERHAKKEENKHNGRVVLSLFWDSPKEGALTYTDRCRAVPP